MSKISVVPGGSSDNRVSDWLQAIRGIDSSVGSGAIATSGTLTIDRLKATRDALGMSRNPIDAALRKKDIYQFENVMDDLATGEEVIMGTRYTKNQVGDALSPFVKKLDAALGGYAKSFLLTEPRKVTHKSEKGFGKLPLLGGEEFEGVGVYEGKRDGVIFQFEAKGIDGLIEVNGADALDTLGGFDEFIEATLGFNLTDGIDKLVAEALSAKQREEVTRQSDSYDGFGSW